METALGSLHPALEDHVSKLRDDKNRRPGQIKDLCYFLVSNVDPNSVKEGHYLPGLEVSPGSDQCHRHFSSKS